MRRFVSLRGYPKKFISDNGSQIVAVSKELKKLVKSLSSDELKSFGIEYGTVWEFSPPTAPWMNGCDESLIKGVKKGLKHAIDEQHFSYSEMQTVMYEVGNLVNEDQ